MRRMLVTCTRLDDISCRDRHRFSKQRPPGFDTMVRFISLSLHNFFDAWCVCLSA